MEMTPREIAGNFQFMMAREQRLTANMAYAVRLGMAADKAQFASEMDKLLNGL